MVIMALRFVADRIMAQHVRTVRVLAAKPRRERFRTDAKAEGMVVRVGGWELSHGEDTQKARWFSVALTPQSAPWAYAKGVPFRTIAALELCNVRWVRGVRTFNRHFDTVATI